MDGAVDYAFYALFVSGERCLCAAVEVESTFVV